MTLKFNRALEVVEVDVRATYNKSECSGWWIIESTSFSALSRSGEKSDNLVCGQSL